MSRIQMALGYVDLFYTTNESFFINEAKSDPPAPKPPEPPQSEFKPPEPPQSEFKPPEPEKKDDNYSNYSDQF